MLTIQALQAYGADTRDGLSRCMDNEAFYLRLVGMLKADTHLADLEKALDDGDVKAGFDAAHALKGVLANLSLTPLLEPISDITERLRAGSAEGCGPLLARARERMEALLALMDP